jgi:hypothetical protein
MFINYNNYNNITIGNFGRYPYKRDSQHAIGNINILKSNYIRVGNSNRLIFAEFGMG